MANRMKYYSQEEFEPDPSPLPRECSSSNLRSRSSLRFEGIVGNGMSCIGIYDGDRVIVDTKEKPRDGDVVAATVDGNYVCRRVFWQDGMAHFRREDGFTPDIITENYKIHGVVVGKIGACRFADGRYNPDRRLRSPLRIECNPAPIRFSAAYLQSEPADAEEDAMKQIERELSKIKGLGDKRLAEVLRIIESHMETVDYDFGTAEEAIAEANADYNAKVMHAVKGKKPKKREDDPVIENGRLKISLNSDALPIMPRDTLYRIDPNNGYRISEVVVQTVEVQAHFLRPVSEEMRYKLATGDTHIGSDVGEYLFFTQEEAKKWVEKFKPNPPYPVHDSQEWLSADQYVPCISGDVYAKVETANGIVKQRVYYDNGSKYTKDAGFWTDESRSAKRIKGVIAWIDDEKHDKEDEA